VGVPGGGDRGVSGVRLLVAGSKFSVFVLVLILPSGRPVSSNIAGCVRLYDVRTLFYSCHKTSVARPASLPVLYRRTYCTCSVSIHVVLCRRKNMPSIPLPDPLFPFGICPSKLLPGALASDSGGTSILRRDMCLRGCFASFPLCTCCIARTGLYVLIVLRLPPFLFFVADCVGCRR